MESITTPESEPEKILTWECVHQEERYRTLTDPIFSGLVRPGVIYSSKFCFVGYDVIEVVCIQALFCLAPLISSSIVDPSS